MLSFWSKNIQIKKSDSLKKALPIFTEKKIIEETSNSIIK